MVCNKCGQSLPEDSTFCQYCGNKIEAAPPAEQADSVAVAATAKPIDRPTPKPKKSKGMRRLTAICNICIGVLALAAIVTFSFIIIIVETERRKYYQDSVLWCSVLIAVYSGYLIAVIFSLIKNIFFLSACFSPIVLAITIAISINIYDLPYANVMQGACSIIFLLNFLTILVFGVGVVICKAKIAWHNSIAYREGRYRKIAKMQSYMERGIITEQEFEKAREDILKYVPR